MKTRRKSSRKAAGATDGEVDQEPSSQIADESQPPSPSQPGPLFPHTIHISIPPDISLESLSALIPDTSIDAPTPDTILHIYKLIIAQAADLAGATSELEEARAQIVRKDVELDQALQDKESSVSELEQSIETARNELKLAVRQRDELNASHATLQSQISTISSSQSTRTSELETLHRRIEDTEREKRDLVVVVDRLKSDGVQAEGATTSLAVGWH
jgi:nucleoprotein TPR